MLTCFPPFLLVRRLSVPPHSSQFATRAEGSSLRLSFSPFFVFVLLCRRQRCLSTHPRPLLAISASACLCHQSQLLFSLFSFFLFFFQFCSRSYFKQHQAVTLLDRSPRFPSVFSECKGDSSPPEKREKRRNIAERRVGQVKHSSFFFICQETTATAAVRLCEGSGLLLLPVFLISTDLLALHTGLSVRGLTQPPQPRLPFHICCLDFALSLYSASPPHVKAPRPSQLPNTPSLTWLLLLFSPFCGIASRWLDLLPCGHCCSDLKNSKTKPDRDSTHLTFAVFCKSHKRVGKERRGLQRQRAPQERTSGELVAPTRGVERAAR